MGRYLEDNDLGISDLDDKKLVFVDSLDYWNATITEPNIDELVLNFNVFLEDNA